jgi:regulation of enolase protein 1 (concanavalin A-like superfamily)
MIRETLDPAAANVLINLRPNDGTAVLVRASTGAVTANVGTTTQPPPAWVKLVRTGNSITASASPDGSSWSVVATTTVTMTPNVLIGLAVNSHDTSQLNTSVFDNVTVTAGSSTSPPAAPNSPSPDDAATGVAANASLTWSAVGATSYDVSFGSTNPPPQVASGVTSASYTPSSMAASATYFWRVNARNSAGASLGPVWSFTTAPEPGGGALPAPWIADDVGAVTPAGTASHSSGTFTVEGGASGDGVWARADALHFVHRTVSGDGEIVARVRGLENTNADAKAGVMIRAGLEAGAAQATVAVTPGGAVQFLSRPAANEPLATAAPASQTPPAWLRLVKSGSSVTGYVSANGTSWTQVGSAVVPLGAAPIAGLAVSSYDSAVLNTATFDSVAMTDSSSPPPPPPTAAGDVVIYASDIPASARHGSWRVANDSLSPDGIKLRTRNNGVAITSAPLANPTHYVDVAFTAEANTPYRLWIRMRAGGDSPSNDSVWVQFSDALVNGSSAFRVNTTSGLLVNLATDGSGSSLAAWGWQNTAYWLSQPTTFTFGTSGMHTLRIQVREDGAQFDQIVLSPGSYLQSPPGAASRDTTIVPKE